MEINISIYLLFVFVLAQAYYYYNFSSSFKYFASTYQINKLGIFCYVYYYSKNEIYFCSLNVFEYHSVV